MASGVVKWWNPEKGFGFARTDEVSEDVFLHFSELDLAGPDRLGDGTYIDFEIGQGSRGPTAIGIRAPGKPAPVLTMSNRAPVIVETLSAARAYVLPHGPQIVSPDCMVTHRGVSLADDDWSLEIFWSGLLAVDVRRGPGGAAQVVLTTPTSAVEVHFVRLGEAHALSQAIASSRSV